jgi:hypothetical protein
VIGLALPLALALQVASPAAPPPQTVAPPAPRPLLMVSMGYYTCEDWTIERRLAPWRAAQGMDARAVRRLEQWVWGYMEAFSRYGHPRGKVPMMKNPIFAELDTYCAAHQTALIVDSVSQLVERLWGRGPQRR